MLHALLELATRSPQVGQLIALLALQLEQSLQAAASRLFQSLVVAGLLLPGFQLENPINGHVVAVLADAALKQQSKASLLLLTSQG